MELNINQKSWPIIGRYVGLVDDITQKIYFCKYIPGFGMDEISIFSGNENRVYQDELDHFNYISQFKGYGE